VAFYTGPAPLFEKRPDQKHITLRFKKCQVDAYLMTVDQFLSKIFLVRQAFMVGQVWASPSPCSKLIRPD